VDGVEEVADQGGHVLEHLPSQSFSVSPSTMQFSFPTLDHQLEIINIFTTF
jgi:hypothetical protein